MIRNWNEESIDHRNALLYAMGVSPDEAERLVIGIVNAWNEMNPGHFHFKAVVEDIKEEIHKAGALARELPITGSAMGSVSNTPEIATPPAQQGSGHTEVETTAK